MFGRCKGSRLILHDRKGQSQNQWVAAAQKQILACYKPWCPDDYCYKKITLSLTCKIIGFFFFTTVNQIVIIPYIQALLEQNYANNNMGRMAGLRSCLVSLLPPSPLLLTWLFSFLLCRVLPGGLFLGRSLVVQCQDWALSLPWPSQVQSLLGELKSCKPKEKQKTSSSNPSHTLSIPSSLKVWFPQQSSPYPSHLVQNAFVTWTKPQILHAPPHPFRAISSPFSSFILLIPKYSPLISLRSRS